MLSEDGRVGLVFNGCIYNFHEIRAELETRGHRFRSQCDTEVLLRGYLEWGVDVLAPKLRGMFAFAVWDDRTRTLAMVRDRLGVKPLVFAERPGELAFASTVRALRCAGFGDEIDSMAVLDLLEFGYVTEERSIYRGIRKLPPATIAEWRDGHLVLRSYWSLPDPIESPEVTFEEAVEETERLLVESVRLRLFADVPIGVLLSGGVDSTLVAWAMAKLGANIKAFTVRAPDDPADESAAAARTAQQLGVPHEIVDMPNAEFSLDEMVDAFGEPFSCSSAQAMLWVSRAVKERATVLLTGDGGDDVFLGYPYFLNAYRAQRLARRLPSFAAGAWPIMRPLVPAHGAAKRARNFLSYATGGLGPYVRAHDGLPYYSERGILGDRIAGLELPQRQIPASFPSARGLLSDVLRYHRRTEFLAEFMPKVDGATMYYSIEARAPLLDHRLWDFAARLSPEIHLRGGVLKAVLREIARRRVSPEVAFRRKQGFTVPVERWLAERWSGMLQRLDGPTLLESGGWVRAGALRTPLKEALSRRWVPVQLWRLLVLEHWLQKRAPHETPRPEVAPLTPA